MDMIRLTSWIDAPVERCFHLSLKIGVVSTGSSREGTVDGFSSDLIGEGETLTYQGSHLGQRHTHVSRIEVLRPCIYFREVMLSGSFLRFEHDHHFAAMDDGTRIRDEIRYTLRWGALGRLAARLYVRRQLLRMLAERNALLKRVAESEEWHRYLDGSRDLTTTVLLKKRVVSDRGNSPLLRGSQG